MDEDLKLLVVEDDPVDVRMIRRVLERPELHQSVQTAPNMEEAKQCLRREHFDAVILDLGLPDSQGLDAVVDMQATAPDLPIVVLSGNADPELAVRSVDMGAEDFIVKEQLERMPVARSLRYAIERHRRKARLFHDNDALWRSLQAARHDAESDALTTVANRRGLERYLAELARSGDAALSTVLVLDMDHFKQINDHYGHDVGDAVLREASARMRASLEKEDLVARVGGDEFVAVLRRSGRRSALRSARRLLGAIYQQPFVWAGQQLNVSATVALFELGAEDLTLEHVLAKAHPLLLRGKGAGRARMEAAWQDGGEHAGGSGAVARRQANGRVRPLFRTVDGLELGQLFQPGLAPVPERRQGEAPLLQTWLDGARWARAWMARRQPEGLLHLDLDLRQLPPGFSQDLRSLFGEEERKRCVLYIQPQRGDHCDSLPTEDLRLLRQLGFQVGLRGLGDGNGVLEDLVRLEPQWIRFDASVSAGLIQYPEKISFLRSLCALLKPLDAAWVGEAEGEDVALLADLGFQAYCRP